MLAGGPSDFQGVKGKDKCILFLDSQKNNPAFGLYPIAKQRGRESKPTITHYTSDLSNLILQSTLSGIKLHLLKHSLVHY